MVNETKQIHFLDVVLMPVAIVVAWTPEVRCEAAEYVLFENYLGV